MDKIIEQVRPKLLIGISTRNKLPPKDKEDALVERGSQVNACCDVCGISIDKNTRFTIEYKDMWFNACSMCYYTQNIDRIPHYIKGEIVFYPELSQERLYTLLRAIWSVEYFASIDGNNPKLEEMQASLSELLESFSSLKDVTNGYVDTSNPDIISSMLNLLTDEEYKERYKLFTSFRWMPDKETFEDDIPRWAQQSFTHLSPDRMSSNITKFMAKYVPSFKVNE